MQSKSKPNIITTFSVETAKRWIELGIKPVFVGFNAKAQKHSWYFAKDKLIELDAYTEKPLTKKRTFIPKKKKQTIKKSTPKSNQYDNIIKWKRIAKNNVTP